MIEFRVVRKLYFTEKIQGQGSENDDPDGDKYLPFQYVCLQDEIRVGKELEGQGQFQESKKYLYGVQPSARLGQGVHPSRKSGKDGKWQLKLKTPKAGGPYDITIKGNNTIELKNVLIGEVWVCSGQSNMQWSMKGTENPDKDIAAANYPNIRLFTVERVIADKPQDDCNGNWSACSPETVAGFSAVGYFFGKHLTDELDIPIGLISTNWGGF